MCNVQCAIGLNRATVGHAARMSKRPNSRYRRIAFGDTWCNTETLRIGHAVGIANPRYGAARLAPQPKERCVNALSLPTFFRWGRFLNPKGIPAQSPGLARRAYPGNAANTRIHPQRGCGIPLGFGEDIPCYYPLICSRAARIFFLSPRAVPV